MSAANEGIRVGILHTTCDTRFLVEIRFGDFETGSIGTEVEEKALAMYHPVNSNHYIIKLNECPQCGKWVEPHELRIIEVIRDKSF
jgi:hypothetical protein